MPVHQRAKSYQRAASLPPSSPPLSMRPSNASRDRQRRTPIVPSARRQRLLQTTAAELISPHIEAALASLPQRRSAAPSLLGSPIVLRTNHKRNNSFKEEDEDVFMIHRPDSFEVIPDSVFSSRQARALDWRHDPFEDSPAYIHGQRPKHKKRSSSTSGPASIYHPLYPQGRTPLPTLLSATPSPAISAANSPSIQPLLLAPEMDVDFDLLMPPNVTPAGWPGVIPRLASNAFGSLTPALSTPNLSPSASSTTGSPFLNDTGDYFTPRTPNTPSTPLTPRPVPSS